MASAIFAVAALALPALALAQAPNGAQYGTKVGDQNVNIDWIAGPIVGGFFGFMIIFCAVAWWLGAWKDDPIPGAVEAAGAGAPKDVEAPFYYGQPGGPGPQRATAGLYPAPLNLPPVFPGQLRDQYYLPQAGTGAPPPAYYGEPNTRRTAY